MFRPPVGRETRGIIKDIRDITSSNIPPRHQRKLLMPRLPKGHPSKLHNKRNNSSGMYPELTPRAMLSEARPRSTHIGRIRVVYPWTDWIRAGKVTLRRGIDYHCRTSSMVSMIRNRVVRFRLPYRVSCIIAPDDLSIDVTFVNRPEDYVPDPEERKRLVSQGKFEEVVREKHRRARKMPGITTSPGRIRITFSNRGDEVDNSGFRQRDARNKKGL